MMKLTDFDYALPKELIAQHPAKTRGEERLLVVKRSSDSFEEKSFKSIAGYFKKGDLLVLNDTRVIPARLFGRRKTGGRVEIFLVGKDKNPAEALVRPSARIKEGESITLESGDEVRILGKTGIGRLVEFGRPAEEIMERCGHVPLPPYIARRDEENDKTRYQTIYAVHDGATASPTAGLHFTEETLEGLKEKGISIAYVTLHVSYGTFAPVKEEDVERHKMHSEFYRITEGNARLIDEARKRKARIFACGTTSLRALETRGGYTTPASGLNSNAGLENGIEGFTGLFIYPGYKFRMVDALITNFHLPKSTLILLASAFAGRNLLLRAYEYAIRKRFRFFSYGDAMLIL